MNIDEQTEEIIQELQILEQNLQGLMMQKQALQLELNETINALEEIKKTNDEVYKVIGTVMLKADKQTILKELEEKKKILELRVNAIEKQEKLIESKAEELKEETKKALNAKEKSKS
ncbi:MAG: prefoldin subunit beta [Nanoarchaeota archaeon]|nr:prefoldin subunit beta [Nanoarchaeota archaeon]